ncbi:MAG: methionyl-tRNA formyltransferase [Candidatus Paceibacterota bacterium]
MSIQDPQMVFFGTDDFSVLVLEELARRGILPDLIVTAPDTPQGRQLKVLPPSAKVWALAHGIAFLQPYTLDAELAQILSKQNWDVFLVASYGKIIPKDILDIPTPPSSSGGGSLNIHPSLLPKLRGASPIQSAILEEDKTGVTLMQMDEKMDHGPIIAQKEVTIEDWPPKAGILEAILAREGGALFAEALPAWLAGSIKPKAQDHEQATFTKKITKDQAELDLTDDPETNYRKIQAFHEWPRAYFFIDKPLHRQEGNDNKKIRVIVTDAELRNGDGDRSSELIIRRVIPEGKKEMDYESFKRGYEK